MAEILKRDKVRVQIVTENYKIEGDIPTHEGYRGRLSDIMNDSKMFLNLSNVTVYSLEHNKEIYKLNFICFNKADIILISPIEI